MADAVKVLFVGVAEALQQQVTCELKSFVMSAIGTAEVFFENLEQITDATVDLIFLGSGLEGVTPMELAQALRMQAAGSQIHLLAEQGAFLDIADLMKNGCNQAFFLPLDKSTLAKNMRLLESSITGAAVTIMESVPLIDLEAGTEVDFEVSVFLPMNKKYVKVFRKGAKIKEEQVQKMEQHSINQLFIDEKDVGKFLSYSTQRLKSLTTGAKSSLEQKQKLQSTVRVLFQDLLTSRPTTKFEDGKEYVSHTQKIVADYVGSPAAFDLQKELSRSMGSNTDFYDRSGRVSTTATLFSLAMQKGSPESVAIAGLFLDLGLASLPPEIAAKEPSAMTKAEFEIYAKHPLESARILQERKMVLAPEILDGIVQHHERFDGKGFPKALPAHRIHITAQILYISDQFVTLSAPQDGKANLSPSEIFAMIAKDGGANPEILTALREALGVSKEKAA